ncbi:hypothetical protein L3V83_09785 [Thiotrichales bacterium 19X7-9]|nr:hypothetical protein [Thiotrichales bacterium 19X7-9]
MVKRGNKGSTFNSIYSNHKIYLSTRQCTNKDCRRVIEPTIQGIFGDYRHPELVEIQTKLSANHSFSESQEL